MPQQRSHAQVGRSNRRKGQEFELVLRDELRRVLGPLLPDMVARRSSQSERAHDSDVVLEGDFPQWLKTIWWECQHSKAPDPEAKLEQAFRDVAEYERRTGLRRYPVVVWRQHGVRAMHATTTLDVSGYLLVGQAWEYHIPVPLLPTLDAVVTMGLDLFLAALARRVTAST